MHLYFKVSTIDFFNHFLLRLSELKSKLNKLLRRVSGLLTMTLTKIYV